MKKIGYVIAFVLLMMGCNKPEDKPKVEMEHNTSACGVYDPLNNIPWLKQYCQDIQTQRDLSSIRIVLYKTTDTLTGEEMFYFISHTMKKKDEERMYSEYRDCSGTVVIDYSARFPYNRPTGYDPWVDSKKWEWLGDIFRCTWNGGRDAF